jgi:hypothetical protein
MNLLFVILYLTNFLRTIGLIVVLYFVFKFVGRLLFPVVIKKAVNNMQARQAADQRAQRRDGEVTVENTRQQKAEKHFDQGEYVDFEEID